MKRRRLNPGALTAPLPPALVTVGNMEKHNVLTVAWTGILATVPPKTYVSVRPSRYSHGMLKEGGEFVINLMSEDYAREVDFAGIYTGAKIDKFKRCGFTAVESESVKAPTIGESQLSLECRVSGVMSMGSHDVFLADIVGVSCREELMNEEGRLCLERARLLAYAHGEYYSLGEKLGKFGFSTDKPGKSAAKKRITGDGQKKTNGKSEQKTAKEKPFYYGMSVGKKKKSPSENKDKGKRRKP